jgi:hypothetical protein
VLEQFALRHQESIVVPLCKVIKKKTDCSNFRDSISHVLFTRAQTSRLHLLQNAPRDWCAAQVGVKTHGELRTESVETPVLPPNFT